MPANGRWDLIRRLKVKLDLTNSWEEPCKRCSRTIFCVVLTHTYENRLRIHKKLISFTYIHMTYNIHGTAPQKVLVRRRKQ